MSASYGFTECSPCDRQKAKEMLGVPEEQEVVMLAPLGYPESEDAFGAKQPRARTEDVYTEV